MKHLTTEQISKARDSLYVKYADDILTDLEIDYIVYLEQYVLRLKEQIDKNNNVSNQEYKSQRENQ